MQNIDHAAAVALAQIAHNDMPGERVTLLAAPVTDVNDPDAPGWAIVTDSDEDTGHRARSIADACSLIASVWSAPDWGLIAITTSATEAADMGVAAYEAGQTPDQNPVVGQLAAYWRAGWEAARDLADPAKQAAPLAEYRAEWRAEG